HADEWGGTMLIANGLRPGPGRACPPLSTSDICPPLSLAWSQPLAAIATDAALSPQERRAAPALANWLDCATCEHRELDAVTHYRQAVVHKLISSLTQGPSRGILGALEKALAERYEQPLEHRKKNPYAPITVTKERFGAPYGGSLDARQRIRAAQALAIIGG